MIIVHIVFTVLTARTFEHGEMIFMSLPYVLLKFLQRRFLGL